MKLSTWHFWKQQRKGLTPGIFVGLDTIIYLYDSTRARPWNLHLPRHRLKGLAPKISIILDMAINLDIVLVNLKSSALSA
jgi:hypothetical protein